MSARQLAPAAAAAVLLALLGLVLLAGGGAVANGVAAGATPPGGCLPAPTPTGSGTAGPGPGAAPSPPGPTGPRAAFAAAYLTRLHAPTSPANLTFLAAWMTAESGPDSGSPTLAAARYNPLNTTMTEPGSWAYNSAGVQNYPTLQAGVTAAADTTKLPAYAGLRAALRTGTDPLTAAQALAASPWGTGTLALQILTGSDTTTCVPPPAGGDIGTVLGYAQAQLGKPYQWAAAGPDSYDCSGLTMTAYATIGVQLPHNAALQATHGTPVPARAFLLPGDLVFFGHPIHHVGLYTGDGQMIDAPHTGAVIRYDPLWTDYSGAVRLLTPSPSPAPTS